MKKVFLIFALVSAICITKSDAQSVEPIFVPLDTRQENDGYGGIHHSPILKPQVYLDVETNTLLFCAPLYGCSINIIISSGEIVFSSSIPDGAYEFQLPPSISGECELQIVRGSIMFVGYISI